MLSYQDFSKVDIRLGKIIKVEKLPNAKHTTHKLTVDFGKEIGIKISCARLVNYSEKELQDKLIIGVINLNPKQIGTTISEVLILGVPDKNSECILLSPDKPDSELGSRVY